VRGPGLVGEGAVAELIKICSWFAAWDQ
jgi:hypothetical protein